MKIRKIFAATLFFFSLIPTFAVAIDEGLYTDGVRYVSVLKNKDNLVKFHLLEFDINEWETFSGYENSDGSVTFFSHSDDNSARWNISTTTEGVKAVRELCLGEDCDGGNVELSFDLYLPDTGGSFSGQYQSLAMQNLIIHQVGNKALSIELFQNPSNSNEYGFDILRWDLVDNTLVLGSQIYTSYDDDDTFEGDVIATTSGSSNRELTVTIDNCVVSADAELTCEDLEEILSARRIF